MKFFIVTHTSKWIRRYLNRFLSLCFHRDFTDSKVKRLWITLGIKYFIRQNVFLKIWFINGVDNVNWPPYRDWKADVLSVSPSSERIRIFLCRGMPHLFTCRKLPAVNPTLVLSRLKIFFTEVDHGHSPRQSRGLPTARGVNTSRRYCTQITGSSQSCIDHIFINFTTPSTKRFWKFDSTFLNFQLWLDCACHKKLS